MKPTIGRIVLANLGNVHPAHRQDGYPAIVTGVNQDGTLELNAQVDSAFYRGRQQTNVCLSNVAEGKPEGEGQRWWWPPRDASALGTSDQPQGGGAPVTAQPPEGGYGPDVKAGGSDLGGDGQTVAETDADGKPVN